MFKNRTFKILLCTLSIAAVLMIMAGQLALSDTTDATVYGQVTMPGGQTPVDGATVTCNGNTATTSDEIYDGFYSFTLPIGANYPVTATYTANGITYQASDNIDLTGVTASQVSQPIGLGTLVLQQVAAATPTPTPNPNATATPTPTATATATPTATPVPTTYTSPGESGSYGTDYQPVYTPTPTPTPVPTTSTDLSQISPSVQAPAPRKVFTSPQWNGNSEAITVTNTGNDPIQVRAWVNDPSNNVTASVNAGQTETISTASILTQDNQVLNVGFDAYDDGAKIDTYSATIAVGSTPTPAATTRSPGFIGILGIACLLGVAYLVIKKER